MPNYWPVLARGTLLATFCAVCIPLSGCFVGENPFCEEKDAIKVDGIVGKYTFGTNGAGGTVLSVAPGKANHYECTLAEPGSGSIKLDAMFFRLGTNLFVNLHRISDSVAPTPGGAPSQLEWLKLGTDKFYSCFRVKRSATNVEFQSVLNLGGSPTGKLPPAKWKPYGEDFLVAQNSTEELKNILTKIASDDSSFPGHYIFKKEPK